MLTLLATGGTIACTPGRNGLEPTLGAADLLRALVAAGGDAPQILIGAGVNADVIRALQPHTGARAFHLSAKRTEDSRMVFRRAGVPMGLPGISEFEVWRCEEQAVRAARQALEALCGS